MKNSKTILIGIFLMLALVGLASAAVSIDVTQSSATATGVINNTVNVSGAGVLSINFDNFTYGAPSGVYVNTSMYNMSILTGTGNWGNGARIDSNATQCIYNNHTSAIRQDGVIKYYEFDCIDKSKLSSYKINVWRKNGSTYTLINQTDNLKPLLVDGLNNISVSIPVDEGDFIGESIIGAGTSGFAFYAGSVGSCKYSYGYDPIIDGTNSTYAWDSYSNLAVTHVILAKIQSPDMVFIGDSICAGHPGHYSYLETTSTTNIPSSYEYWFRNVGNVSYQNMGIGGQTTTQIATRFANDVIASHPKYVVIEGGVNDVSQNTTNETILGNYETMLDACDEADIKPVIVLILPWHNSAVEKKKQIDYLNEQLIIKASEHNCCYIDVRDTIGHYDADLGTWDVDTVYNADGVHFTAAGYEAVGKEMFYQFVNITANGVRYDTTNKPILITLQNVTNSNVIIASSNIAVCANTTITRSNPVFSATPSNGIVSVNVVEWTTSYKKWVESSETHDAITQHTIGGFPADTLIQLNVDGIKAGEFPSNSTGQIEFSYTGYSEHTFEAFVLSEFDIARHGAASVWSSSIALLAALVLIIFSGLLLAAVRGTLSIPLLTNAVIGLMVLTLVVLAGAGILSSFEGLI